jgi:hypothetical protein
MRERAAAGGTARAGPAPAGGYRVTATLPVLNAAAADPAAAVRDPQPGTS